MKAELSEAKKQLEEIKKEYLKRRGVEATLLQQKKDKEWKSEKIQKQTEEVIKKELLLKRAAKEGREQAKVLLENMATKALQFIAGDHLSLEIQVKEKAGKDTAEFYIVSTYENKKILTDPTEEDGGGYADIVSMSLFIAMLQMTSKTNDAPLFLDEPSKYVSKGDLSEKVAQFIYDIAHYFNRQVCMVTHDEYMKNIGDHIYHVGLNQLGESQVIKQK